jgi:hypothetical protein
MTAHPFRTFSLPASCLTCLRTRKAGLAHAASLIHNVTIPEQRWRAVYGGETGGLGYAYRRPTDLATRLATITGKLPYSSAPKMIYSTQRIGNRSVVVAIPGLEARKPPMSGFSSAPSSAALKYSSSKMKVQSLHRSQLDQTQSVLKEEEQKQRERIVRLDYESRLGRDREIKERRERESERD